MKIAYLNPIGSLGGAEQSLLNVLASVRAAEPGWSLSLIVGADGPLVARAMTLDVTTTILSFPAPLARLGDAGAGGPAGNEIGRLGLARRLCAAGIVVPSYTRRLRWELRAIAADVIHTNGFKMHVLGAWSRPPGTPVIWHVHDYVRSRPIMARLLRRNAGRCAAVVANSHSVARDVRSVCGPGLPVYPVFNGIDLARFSPVGPALDLDALAGLPPAGPKVVRVGFLGTMARWKGQRVFLQALSRLPVRIPVRGYVIGGALYGTDGSQYSLDELRGLAAELGIAHTVGFTGFVEEPAAAIRALDIVVHASTEPEPFGLVIAEAMACGRAVIVSEAGGAAELIEPGVTALGHPPGDVAALSERIGQLASDPDRRARLGKEARATAERCFDRARLATDLIPIYHRAVSSST